MRPVETEAAAPPTPPTPPPNPILAVMLAVDVGCNDSPVSLTCVTTIPMSSGGAVSPPPSCLATPAAVTCPRRDPTHSYLSCSATQYSLAVGRELCRISNSNPSFALYVRISSKVLCPFSGLSIWQSSSGMTAMGFSFWGEWKRYINPPLSRANLLTQEEEVLMDLRNNHPPGTTRSSCMRSRSSFTSSR
ncbi:hypothetical protein B484DRAFT_449071 [Ochromonadaceae sp. CCMP2298]|nr:hypothetical protein B484DRAFT_449071 [Ochromonadaceae sp. CCMP2298]